MLIGTAMNQFSKPIMNKQAFLFLHKIVNEEVYPSNLLERNNARYTLAFFKKNVLSC